MVRSSFIAYCSETWVLVKDNHLSSRSVASVALLGLLSDNLWPSFIISIGCIFFAIAPPAWVDQRVKRLGSMSCCLILSLLVHEIPAHFSLNLMNLMMFELRISRIFAVYSVAIACSHEGRSLRSPPIRSWLFNHGIIWLMGSKSGWWLGTLLSWSVELLSKVNIQRRLAANSVGERQVSLGWAASSSWALGSNYIRLLGSGCSFATFTVLSDVDLADFRILRRSPDNFFVLN